MALYDEQIRERSRADEEMLEASFAAAADAVMGKSFSLNGNYQENALGRVLQYFNSRITGMSFADKAPEENMNLALKSAGIMKRMIFLYGDWYRSTWGVYLLKFKSTGEVTSAIPRRMGNLYYFDARESREIRITSKNAGLFETEALCLYRPLPNRALTIADVYRFCLSTWSAADVIYMLCMLLLSTLIGLLTPKISYFMFSQVAASESLSLLLSTFIFGAMAGIGSVLIRTEYLNMTSRIGVKMRAQVEPATMMRVLALPLEFFSEYSAGDLSRRVEYVQEFCMQIVDCVLVTGLSAVFSLAYFSQIIIYAPSLTPAVAVIVVVSLLFYFVSSVYQYRVSLSEFELSAKNQGMAYDTITGIEKIKLAGAEKRMFSRYAMDFAGVARVAYNPPLIIKLSTPIALFILLAGQFAIYYLALINGVGYAEYYAFQTAYGSISAGLSALSAVAITAARLHGYFLMIKPVIETEPELKEDQKSLENIKGNIELNNVTFRYKGSRDNVINGIDLKIRAGEYVAVVGKSGCGKSTLVRLLLGFLKPVTGAIYYDGNDLAALEKSSLRRKIGVVMQNDGLFTGTIYHNITVSVPGASLETAWKAADIAGIGDNIRRLPMGMNTVVGEGTGGFSGGEKQRLIIARAVAPDPKILIFDEATSALDNRTQKQVSDALDRLDCTRIIIAHRLSTIKQCSRILFMDNGRIVEEGTYDELIALKGQFAQLVERQRIKEFGS